MSIASGYTLKEAKEMLKVWKDAERALASGQAKRYRIGSREFESVDLPHIAARIKYFSDLVEALSGEARTMRVARFIPRDL